MKISAGFAVIAVIGLLVVLKMLGVGPSMMRISDPASNKVVLILAVIAALVIGVTQLRKKG